MGQHTAKIQWQRGAQNFLDNRYSREHVWEFDGGAQIPASASPLIVPEPQSVAALVDPEEAFVAALSSCHMLFFLSLAAQVGLLIDEYVDNAVGVLGLNEQNKQAITQVVLRPRIKTADSHPPGVAEMRAMHKRAHEQCFLARSVNCPVILELD